MRATPRALDLAPNKTDANDADGLAQLAEIGYFKEVRVKGFDNMLTRTLTATRTRLVRMTVELSNQIRGLMKTFGLVVPAGQGSTFEKNVRNLLAGDDELAKIILPMLGAWHALRERAAELGRRLTSNARGSQACQILMSIPGIGIVTATSFMAAIEDPGNFRKSRSVAAWLGLTTRRYQSGDVDYDGHISRRDDKHLRGLLYEAAVVILTRSYADSGLRAWGLKLRERVGFKRAATALARRLAVTMHAMLKSGELFNPTLERQLDHWCLAFHALNTRSCPCRGRGQSHSATPVAQPRLSAQPTLEGSPSRSSIMRQLNADRADDLLPASTPMINRALLIAIKKGACHQARY